MLDAEQLGRPCDLRLDLGPRDALRLERKSDVVPDREMRVETVTLEYHRDAAGARRDVVDHLAADDDVPRSLPLETGDDPEEGRLAATRRPQQHHEFTVPHREADPV